MKDTVLQSVAPKRAHLRAFVYGDSMKPGRPEILRYPRDVLARILAELPSEEAARCLALLPAGVQIAIVTRLDRDARARLAHECADWVRVVPILRNSRAHGRIWDR